MAALPWPCGHVEAVRELGAEPVLQRDRLRRRASAAPAVTCAACSRDRLAGSRRAARGRSGRAALDDVAARSCVGGEHRHGRRRPRRGRRARASPSIAHRASTCRRSTADPRRWRATGSAAAGTQRAAEPGDDDLLAVRRPTRARLLRASPSTSSSARSGRPQVLPSNSGSAVDPPVGRRGRRARRTARSSSG